MEESPSGAGSHKRTRPVEAAGAADAQTRPPRLGKHCAFSPSFHRALPHHKHTQRKTRKSTGHWASWSPFSQFRTHMNFRRAEKAAPHIPEAVGAGVMTVAEQQSKYEDWYFGPFTFVLIKPKPNPEAIPVTDAERRSPGPAVVGRGDAI